MRGSLLGPNSPGSTESGSVPQSHAEREPSSTGRPSAVNVAVPSAVLQFAACSSVTCGIAPMSAYAALPERSATIVFTHGIPS
jgi:hypothetical protein